jgi:hypothetical protein
LVACILWGLTCFGLYNDTRLLFKMLDVVLEGPRGCKMLNSRSFFQTFLPYVDSYPVPNCPLGYFALPGPQYLNATLQQQYPCLGGYVALVLTPPPPTQTFAEYVAWNYSVCLFLPLINAHPRDMFFSHDVFCLTLMCCWFFFDYLFPSILCFLELACVFCSFFFSLLPWFLQIHGGFCTLCVRCIHSAGHPRSNQRIHQFMYVLVTLYFIRYPHLPKQICRQRLVQQALLLVHRVGHYRSGLQGVAGILQVHTDFDRCISERSKHFVLRISESMDAQIITNDTVIVAVARLVYSAARLATRNQSR